MIFYFGDRFIYRCILVFLVLLTLVVFIIWISKDFQVVRRELYRDKVYYGLGVGQTDVDGYLYGIVFFRVSGVESSW